MKSALKDGPQFDSRAGAHRRWALIRKEGQEQRKSRKNCFSQWKADSLTKVWKTMYRARKVFYSVDKGKP